MKRKLSITEKKVRAFLILGSIFTVLAAVVAVITQFVVSNDSTDLFGYTNLALQPGLNNITGRLKPREFRALRFEAKSTYDMKIDPSGEQDLYIKQGFVPFSDTDHGQRIDNITHLELCGDQTVYFGIESEGKNSTYHFTVLLSPTTDAGCGFLIPPSFMMALAVGGIFLFVGILFFLLACIYKNRYRTTKAGYMHMTDNIEESGTVFTL